MRHEPLFTAALLLACWPAWWLAGKALAIAGLPWFDLPGRVAAMFLFLTLVRMLFEPAHGASEGDDHGQS